MSLACSKCGAQPGPEAGLEPGDSCPSCGAALVAADEGGGAKRDGDALRRGSLVRQIESFGPYEVIEEVARGGMGVVYKAREKNLKRLVAIKVLLAGEGASEEEIRRFRREAEAASRLQHSNIVPIHAIGELGGIHYFVMDFIEGKTVADMIDDGDLTPRMALDIVEQVADALHYAHQRGVIHRDMKPANIIIDKLGRPQIMDFGLAKQVDEDTGLTRSGTTMGTPAYMPPEQAEGDLAGIDAQSDVYALGAVLYEMLTGIPPFDGPTTMSILMKVLEEEPAPPRQLNPRIHRDIETIALKAMAKEKPRRYASAKDLADDIRRFKAGEVIAAAPAGFFYRLWKTMLRNKEMTAVVSAVFAALIVVAVWFAWRVHAEASRIRLERERSFHQEFGAGKELLDSAREATASGRREAAEEGLVRARDAFKRALSLKSGDQQAETLLAEAERMIRLLKVDYYLGLGRKFHDQQNYEAAEEMYRIVLEDYDRENEAAREGMRKSRGVCTLSVGSVPEGASVYLAPVSFSADTPPAGLGRRLGETPLTSGDIEMGSYRVTLVRQGYATEELPVQLARSQCVELAAVKLHREAEAGENMVLVPAGAARTEAAVIQLKSFYIDRYEYPDRWGVRPKAEVTWIEAARLCSGRGKRLCTLAEWTRACQGGEALSYPYGSAHQPAICHAARPDPSTRSAPAGTYVGCVSGWGVYDMSGNVAEWVNAGGVSPALAAGGSWPQTLPSSLSCTATLYYPPAQGVSKVGFRCCKGEGEGMPPIIDDSRTEPGK